MNEMRLKLADRFQIEVDINLDDLINYTDNGIGTDIWVKDDTMFNGKRLYILAISLRALNSY
ncbi:MAG: hypothetical protein JWR09_1723 [Mucilaginibacter sp.]|nr:hypothetical protein [Mucilaginibacter sp.]